MRGLARCAFVVFVVLAVLALSSWASCGHESGGGTTRASRRREPVAGTARARRDSARDGYSACEVDCDVVHFAAPNR